MTAQGCFSGEPSAELVDEAFDALISAGKAVVVHQILPDPLGVATLAQRMLDEFAIGLAGTCRRGLRRRIGARVGDHLIGRFWAARVGGSRSLAGFESCGRGCAPSAGRPSRNRGRFQISGRSFAPDSGLFFDAPQRPSQPPQRDDFLLLFLVQDVAHIDGEYSPSVNVLAQFFIGRFSGDPVWPVLGDPRGSPRRTKKPTLLQGILVCQQCGYALYRASGGKPNRPVYYYRCIGSDGYRRLAARCVRIVQCGRIILMQWSGSRSLVCWRMTG